MIKWTAEKFDKVVITNGKPIKRIGEFKNGNTYIRMSCLICQHTWKTLPQNIIRFKTGCPKCSNNIKLTNEIIDKRLDGRNIISLENYEKCKKSMLWLCSICQHTWTSSADNILNRKKRGCGNCKGGSKKSDEYYTSKLKNRDIYLVSKIINSKEKSTFKCGKCDNTWNAPINNVCRNKLPSGCPTCLYKQEYKMGEFLKKHLPNHVIDSHVDIKTEEHNFNIDFVIDNHFFVEYNGEQHYKPVSFGSSMDEETLQETFIKQQQRDENLRLYCKNNNIKLFEIKYTYNDTELENYVIEIKRTIYDN